MRVPKKCRTPGCHNVVNGSEVARACFDALPRPSERLAPPVGLIVGFRQRAAQYCPISLNCFDQLGVWFPRGRLACDAYRESASLGSRRAMKTKNPRGATRGRTLLGGRKAHHSCWELPPSISRVSPRFLLLELQSPVTPN